ncbi:hypothetical protein HAX54_048744 [Datura stramonium]|uniref:Uncharacterized protein n=1 Tax=Datura stramonium TaxID=4076 RepID=A0ABS8RQF9_DATST|nr:hypothetical protein [Datura stramonium]
MAIKVWGLVGTVQVWEPIFTQKVIVKDTDHARCPNASSHKLSHSFVAVKTAPLKARLLGQLMIFDELVLMSKSKSALTKTIGFADKWDGGKVIDLLCCIDHEARGNAKEVLEMNRVPIETQEGRGKMVIYKRRNKEVTGDNDGNRGRNLFLWDVRKLECVEVNKGEFLLELRFKNCDNGMIWVFEDIYRPVGKGSKEMFWTS